MLSSNNTDQYRIWNLIYFSFLKQQIEREISFRTESGLYFSYYKQIVLAPSLSQGKQKAVDDHVTVLTSSRVHTGHGKPGKSWHL